MIQRMKLSEIVIDTGIYPRLKPNYEKIKEYAEKIEEGEKFPPIRVNIRTMHLIDGYHRYKAMEKLEFIETEVEVLDIDPELEWVYAVGANETHGLPLNRKKVKEDFEKHYVEFHGKIDVPTLAKIMHIPQKTLYRWIKEIEEKTTIEFERKTKKLTQEEREKIVEMYESGNYSRQEIAEKFEITPDRVNQIVKQSEELPNENSSLNSTNRQQLNYDEVNTTIDTEPDNIIPAPTLKDIHIERKIKKEPPQPEAEEDDELDFDEIEREIEEELANFKVVNPRTRVKKRYEQTIDRMEKVARDLAYFASEETFPTI